MSKLKFTDKQLIELYPEGHVDSVMASILGCSRTDVCYRRIKLGLLANCKSKRRLNPSTIVISKKNTVELHKKYDQLGKVKDYKKKYYQLDRVKERRKKYQQLDRVKERQKKYYQRNKKKKIINSKKYYQKNKEKILLKRRIEYQKKKLRGD